MITNRKRVAKHSEGRTMTSATGLLAVVAAVLLIAGCEEGPSVATPTEPTEPAMLVGSAAVELTNSITFEGGTVIDGRPPAPTNNPGDPQLAGAPATPSTLAPGDEGDMRIDVANIPADTPFDVNIRFEGADQYINVPIDPASVGNVSGTLMRASAVGSTSGTLNLPFSLPDSACDNLGDIQHAITCYESVSVGGVSVSLEQARQLVLDCTVQQLQECSENRPQPTASTFRDCDVCPEMVRVPAGSFMMGSTEASLEGPVHQVTIGQPFAVGAYEVSFAEWDACLVDGGCGGYGPYDQGWGRCWWPVINVSWEDVQSYVEWLSAKTGEEYRLLSEAEWEYVARAGTTTPYHTGETITHDEAHFHRGRDNTQWETVPVGSFAPNAFGLYDVHGNVEEWVQDCLNYNFVGAPADGSAWESGVCGFRVVRGGSWDDGVSALRSAHRSVTRPPNRYQDLGFRVARTLNP